MSKQRTPYQDYVQKVFDKLLSEHKVIAGVSKTSEGYVAGPSLVSAMELREFRHHLEAAWMAGLEHSLTLIEEAKQK